VPSFAARACPRRCAASRSSPGSTEHGPRPATGATRAWCAHRPLLAIGFPDPGSRGTWHCLAAAASHRADLLIDLAALPAEVAVSVARRALREYGCELGEVLWVPEGWIARGPLAEAVLEDM